MEEALTPVDASGGGQDQPNPSVHPQDAWQQAGGRVRVGFAPAVLERIRLEAVRAAHSLKGAGLETAGLLVGSRQGPQIQVEDWLPIHCSYAFGPFFRMTPEDTARLEEQIREANASSRGVVGWFVTRTEDDLAPPQEAQRLHAQLFAEPEQLLMICGHAGRGTVRTRIYARFADQVGFTSLSGARTILPRRPERAAGRRRHQPGAEGAADQPGLTAAAEPLASPWPPLEPLRTPWAAILAFALAYFLLGNAAAWLWSRNQGRDVWAEFLSAAHTRLSKAPSAQHQNPPPLPLSSLHATYRGGRLRLRWDSASLPSTAGLRAEVDIQSPDGCLLIGLSERRWAFGTLTVPVRGPVDAVHLRWATPAGANGRESIRLNTNLNVAAIHLPAAWGADFAK